MTLNNFQQLCDSHVRCPDNGYANHPHPHDLHCALPRLYIHDTHWAICQYNIHPDITTWENVRNTREDT